MAIAGVIIAGLTAILGVAPFVADVRHDYRQWKDAQQIQLGMSADDAQRILGEPSWRDRCGAKFPYRWKKSCVAELGYPSAAAPVPPTYLIIQLDKRNRVISVDTVDDFSLGVAKTTRSPART